ncbi:MAG: hypothetical protein GY928_20400 [Colwellia sp.]|nr:hypothetical protein [Colwellia sp.]
MEVAIWLFVFSILFTCYKVLRFEEISINYQQKDLIKRYLDIKKIDSDYRLQHLREWEKDVELFAKENLQKTEFKVINLESHRVIR